MTFLGIYQFGFVHSSRVVGPKGHATQHASAAHAHCGWTVERKGGGGGGVLGFTPLPEGLPMEKHWPTWEQT